MDGKTIQMDLTNYTNRFDTTIQIEVTKLYKWMRQNYTNGFDENYTNGNDKAIQIDVTKLYK